MIIYPISWVATGSAVLTAYFVISKREYKGEVPPNDQAPTDKVDSIATDGGVVEQADSQDVQDLQEGVATASDFQ